VGEQHTTVSDILLKRRFVESDAKGDLWTSNKQSRFAKSSHSSGHHSPPQEPPSSLSSRPIISLPGENLDKGGKPISRDPCDLANICPALITRLGAPKAGRQTFGLSNDPKCSQHMEQPSKASSSLIKGKKNRLIDKQDQPATSVVNCLNFSHDNTKNESIYKSTTRDSYKTSIAQISSNSSTLFPRSSLNLQIKSTYSSCNSSDPYSSNNAQETDKKTFLGGFDFPDDEDGHTVNETAIRPSLWRTRTDPTTIKRRSSTSPRASTLEVSNEFNKVR
ncbi:unnamed protein product, partial [Protopolystoma xenopodis]